MRILHTADLHLGKSVNEMNMIDDQAFILDEIVHIVQEKKIDVLIVAGDIYDRAVPSERAVELLDRFINAIRQTGTILLMISGNHDSSQRLDFGRALLEQTGVYMTGKYEGHINQVVLQDAYGDVHFYLLPFIKRSQVQYYFPEEKIANYEDALRTVIEKEDMDPTQRNIMVSHQFVVAGHIRPQQAGSEVITSIGTIENVPYSVYEAFDYTALGHIHGPQSIGKDTIRYAGSPLKYSIREVNNDKSVVYLDMKEKGNQALTCISLRPKRDMRHIQGYIKDILAHATPSEDYIYVTLSDETVVMDAMDRIQTVYPNTLKIDYTFQKQAGSGFIYQPEYKQDFTALIKDFYQAMYGSVPDNDELSLLKEVAREAGVIDETD